MCRASSFRRDQWKLTPFPSCDDPSIKIHVLPHLEHSLADHCNALQTVFMFYFETAYQQEAIMQGCESDDKWLVALVDNYARAMISQATSTPDSIVETISDQIFSSLNSTNPVPSWPTCWNWGRLCTSGSPLAWGWNRNKILPWQNRWCTSRWYRHFCRRWKRRYLTGWFGAGVGDCVRGCSPIRNQWLGTGLQKNAMLL